MYGSRSPRPRTHCVGEYPLSSMAEVQVQVTAVVSHVTRCYCSGANLTLNSSSNRLACVFQIPPCRSQTAFCCGVMAAVGMGSHPRAIGRTLARIILLLGRKINLRGTPKGVIQCLKKWSQTIFGCPLGTMATTPKVLARSHEQINGCCVATSHRNWSAARTAAALPPVTRMALASA